MDETWNQFLESGSIADYLAYTAMKGMEYADSQGSCAITKDTW